MFVRSNGYYSSFTYFTSKVNFKIDIASGFSFHLQILFDILPLRIVPPLVYGAIVYRLVGLVPEPVTFWKFLLTLVLFNLCTATSILLISIAFESTSVANLVGNLFMLYK